jgi:DNA-binding NarL/FixJ family response regulator
MMSCRLLASGLKKQRFDVKGFAADTGGLLDAVNGSPPDVALVSARLQNGPAAGIEVLPEIRERQPNVKTVVMLDRSDPNLVVEAFHAGAKGIFSRGESELQALCRCIHSVYMGQVWANSQELGYVLNAFSRSPLLRISGGSNPLSRREEDVVKLVADGLGNRQIAEQLNLSEHTVKNYLFRVFDKLGISTRVELVLWAATRHQKKPANRVFGTEELEAANSSRTHKSLHGGKNFN